MDVVESLEGQVDKDEPYGNREQLLGESGEEAGNGAGVEPHQDKHEHSGPESNPESELQERNVLHVAEVEDEAFEYQCRARGPQDDKGLTRKYGVDEVTRWFLWCPEVRGGGER